MIPSTDANHPAVTVDVTDSFVGKTQVSAKAALEALDRFDGMTFNGNIEAWKKLGQFLDGHRNTIRAALTAQDVNVELLEALKMASQTINVLIYNQNRAKSSSKSEVKQINQNVTAIREAIVRADKAVPDGWKLVPIEPTKEILVDIAAACRNFYSEKGEYPRSQAVYKAMISAAPQPPIHPTGWQPIETAPKDGKRVLVTDGFEVCDAYFRGGEWWQYECGDDWYSVSINPTNWMPLPQPPTMQKEPNHDK